MFIEPTYMRLGHDPTGAIEVTTDYHQMMKWALSFALCGEVSQSVRSLSNNEQDIQHIRHKEEAEDRIKTDWLKTRACATHLMFALTQ